MAKAKQQFLWCLDAGHAPATRGKRSPKLGDGSQLLEYEFARDVVSRLRRMLDEDGIANHDITPHTHTDLPPSGRARMANYTAKQSSMPCRVVSVHANAHKSHWTEANGITVLYHPGSAKSQAMARCFQDHLVDMLTWRDRGIKPRTNLTLLKATRMPAVITETGFYSNPVECKQLMDGEWRDSIADAHASAIGEMEAAAR